MLHFKNFILKENKDTVSHDWHHTTTRPFQQDNHSIFLSHNKNIAKAWHNVTKENETGKKVTTHRIKVNGKIANHRSEKIKNLFKKNKVDHEDYINALASGQNSKEIHDHPGTKLLQKHGYVGTTHDDYDPRVPNWQSDHDSTVVFHRKHTEIQK